MASDRASRAPRAQVGLELREFGRHLGADVELRLGGSTVLGALALGDALTRLLKRLHERILEAQRVLEQRVPEVRRVALAAAAERCAVGGRRGHDERVVVLEGIDEAT